MLQLSCSLISTTFFLLSRLVPIYNDCLKPLLDSLDSSATIVGIANDVGGSLLIGVPGT